MTDITAVDAWEVLDSRGNPTVRVRVDAGDATGQFTVPAGASTGAHEAVERRDGGDRYGGRGVREACAAVRDDLAPVVVGWSVTDQVGVDEALVDCDGTENLSTLGANAVLGVSGAVAHAAADATDRPLYDVLAPDSGPGAMPMPMINVLSGGLHAAADLPIQDFLAVPVGADTYPEALETVWEVRRAAGARIGSGEHPPPVADEGGFIPPVADADAAFELLVDAIRDAGYDPGREVAIAVDVAATHFYDADRDRYDLAGETLDRAAMIDRVVEWVDAYPVRSVEDPLAEDDWTGWERLADRIGDRVQLLGDDLLATNAGRLDRAVDAGAANAALIKPNQAGTITRTRRVVDAAQAADWAPVVSARSGETCDATIADLAVGLDAGQIKIGSLARSERLAKYNRLLGIDRAYDGDFAGCDALAPW
ncbi:phosphopyruvate hydratase [Haloplanus aerogenes]|uniref:Enolase n=1 Tax=Haloplanus aerogenes TaxID=660522 RepID=A0A3G8QSE4_9EURY|nr:phosphopyruvate hydratase [Haloplanus aerogenes]AZH24631.1 phosphopyruvate hydratase [Haloplanus aerogenes]RMB23713.1 enolase [Haloplanus aerogenes]